jgi:hypothetical protein
VGVFGMLWPAAAKPGEGVAAEAPPAHPGRLARPGIVAAVPSVPGGFPEGDMETPGLVREIIPAGPVEPGLPAGGLPTGPTPAGDAAPPVGDPVAPPAPPPAPPEPPPLLVPVGSPGNGNPTPIERQWTILGGIGRQFVENDSHRLRYVCCARHSVNVVSASFCKMRSGDAANSLPKVKGQEGTAFGGEIGGARRTLLQLGDGDHRLIRRSVKIAWEGRRRRLAACAG